MIVKNYLLKQQTPMIHFQSDEDGATLRACEVKPKLDRFLLEQLGGVEVVRKEHRDWFISDDHPALKYKLRFEALKDLKTEQIPYRIFYANMGDERKKNPLKMVCGTCRMTVIYLVPSLEKILEDNMDTFFITHTFGFMQGKGFGGFLPEKCTRTITKEKVATALQSTYKCESVYYIDSTLPIFVLKQFIDGKTKIPPNVFDQIIKPFHSLMKSGINISNYERSFIFQYFYKNPNIHYGNDKAFVKSKGIAPVVVKSTNKNRGESSNKFEKYKYIRALLGITENIEYIDALDSDDKPLKDNRDKVIKTNINIKNTDGIERYASPVRYRIIGNTVYIFAAPINDNLYGADFTFTSTIESGTIPVPSKNEFDIEEFLAAFINHINTNDSARRAANFHNNDNKFKEVQV